MITNAQAGDSESGGDRTVRVASFQMVDIQADVPAALCAITAAVELAQRNGAQVALFPECFLPGYCSNWEQAYARAMDIDSPAFERVREALVNLDPVVIFGLIESEGSELFNAAVIVDNGRLVGRYRKRHPNEMCFSAGEELPIFKTRGLRFGLGICADARSATDGRDLAGHMPDAVLYPLNNMLTKPTADRWRRRHAQVLLARARDTGGSCR